MHELALTEGIIAIVEQEARKNGFERVLEITLKVGEFSGVVPDCLREFFPIASRGTAAEGAALRIEPVPAAVRCEGCGFEGLLPRLRRRGDPHDRRPGVLRGKPQGRISFQFSEADGESQLMNPPVTLRVTAPFRQGGQ